MKKLITVLFVLFNCIFTYSQSIPIDSIFSRMEQQAMLYPTEKIYLHTDRNVYAAGDDIWMKAYVVNGITNIPTKQSRYVYVTLQNPLMEVVSRLCLRAVEDGIIHGNLPLDEELPKGEYLLSAYTRYMQNADEAYFFKKRIMVNHMKNNTIQVETKRRGSHLDILFKNPATQKVIKVNNCVTYVPSGEINVQKKDSGWAVKFHNSKEKVVLVQAGNYKEYVHLDTKPDFDVSFLPEGGNLIPGVANRVAFKSINSQGQGEDIRGTIRDERDSVLLEFHSIYRGMGTFSLIPEIGKKYVAVCDNSDGRIQRFDLPLATNGYSLQVNRIREKFFVKVLHSTDKKDADDLIILAHQKGWPISSHRYKSRKSTYVFKADEFAPGTVSFLLMTSDGRILNERMTFVANENHLQEQLSFDKPEYAKREKVAILLDVKDVDGKLWDGECSVSVTDNHDILPDSCNNILSTLLLESELKGHIENPAWYFRSGNESLRAQALDALMMTQGWRRYDLEQTWQDKLQSPSISSEKSQVISGKVTKRVSRKPVKDAQVQMMLPLLGDKYELVTGEDGTFHFDSFEYPDSSIYFVSAYTDKGKDNIVVELDSIATPRLDNKFSPFRPNDSSLPLDAASSEYLAKTDLRFLQENGIRHYFIDEVIVTAKRLEAKTEYENLIGAKSIKEERIKHSGVNEILPFLRQQCASFNWIERGGSIILTLRGDPVTVILDGSICYPWVFGSQDFIKNYPMFDIMQIDIIYPPFSLCYDPLSDGGVIAFTTKTGAGQGGAKWHPTNLKYTMPLGYQPPAEFYVPRYDFTAERDKKEPDLRTTIHWQPRLEVKNGKANVEFYTADGTVDYTVVIEGVGEDGSLLRVEEKIK